MVDGAHLESADLDEIIIVVGLIRGSAEYLSTYFQTTLEFNETDDLSEY